MAYMFILYNRLGTCKQIMLLWFLVFIFISVILIWREREREREREGGDREFIFKIQFILRKIYYNSLFHYISYHKMRHCFSTIKFQLFRKN